jgi:hypothetical protein
MVLQSLFTSLFTPGSVQAISSVASLALGLASYRIFKIANVISNRNMKTNLELLSTNRVLKQMDILNSCGERYCNIVKERFDMEEKEREISETSAKSFYQRYWEAQHQQFIFWERGYIEDAIFASWMEWRREEWIADGPLSRAVPLNDPKSYRFQWGWGVSRSKFSYTEFNVFIDTVFAKGARPALEEFAAKLPMRIKMGKTRLDFPSDAGLTGHLP